MQSFGIKLKLLLERTVIEAQKVAEIAARIILKILEVDQLVPSPYLTENELDLRHRCQIHGRQLGDTQNTVSGTQTIDILVEEVAYEHWHRMLFARYLAENNLLMYPDPVTPKPITLEECEKLAPKERAANGWELASRLAAKMLPHIFNIDSPVFELPLPPDCSQKLENLLSDLPKEIFTTSDSLAWVYQSWQKDKKNEIKTSEVIIGPRELPRLTQNFTDPYMVNFILDNSLGAWWAGKRLLDSDFKNAPDEKKLRLKAALPEMPLEYLRFIKKKDGSFFPAAGIFKKFPEKFCELKILDPCCGSGSFLIKAFFMLVPMRMCAENLSATKAIDAVLRENIFGFELDRRSVKLATFALTLTAWKYKNSGGYRPLSEINIACTGLSLNLSYQGFDKLKLKRDNHYYSLRRIIDLLMDLPTLGSLINPAKCSAISKISWNKFKKMQVRKLLRKKNKKIPEAIVLANWLATTGTLLANRYHLVIANVPYLSNKKETLPLKKFCRKYYPGAHYDLATVFLKRCQDFCVPEGTTSVVLPQNLLSLTIFRKFRKKLLKKNIWHLLARIGNMAFESGANDNINVMLLSLSRKKSESLKNSTKEQLEVVNNELSFCEVDVSAEKNISLKSEMLKKALIKTILQPNKLKNLNSIIGLDNNAIAFQLSSFAKEQPGVITEDDPHFLRYFWELPKISKEWVYLQSSPESTLHYGGTNSILWMGGLDFVISANKHLSRIQGKNAWGRAGLVVDQMNEFQISLHTGAKHYTNCTILLPYRHKHLPAIWCFCTSPKCKQKLSLINQQSNATKATLVKVPFDLDYWNKVALKKYPYGLPAPYTNDPTQWIFHGHPCGSVLFDEEKKKTTFGPLRTDVTVLQVAVARLLGYRWPAELDTKLNLAYEQRELTKRCESLSPYTATNGILPIPSVLREPSASDRLLDLLKASYGEEWSDATLNALLNNLDLIDKTIEYWLREKFFFHHCRLFNHRPFIWHIWDGRKDGFAVLVNYHKLDYKLLETLIYSYLGDWIELQKMDISKNINGAKERLYAALALHKKLELILVGENPYDIFVRWKTLSEQASGWHPDLNDGVRLNIRPFLTFSADIKSGGEILRNKPKIKWQKDMGINEEFTPWYHIFKGKRFNNYHLSLQEKVLNPLKKALKSLKKAKNTKKS
ncbi:MAG: N-6 DNA methylase [Deltaproteobacteria bacterium]|jgi:hypothetical protein|nr:N-6 DNA methylase [Deltaproteobacteria bacterium]